jgi:hypothetical protein
MTTDEEEDDDDEEEMGEVVEDGDVEDANRMVPVGPNG